MRRRSGLLRILNAKKYVKILHAASVDVLQQIIDSEMSDIDVEDEDDAEEDEDDSVWDEFINKKLED